LIDATNAFLAERAQLGRTTSYTELNTVLHGPIGARPFDFAKDSERAAMGALLGAVAQEQLPVVGALVSSIVLYLNDNDAGSGFYRLAIDLNLLTPKPTPDQRLAFWAGQVKATYEYYA
jgi:hypothetical protein